MSEQKFELRYEVYDDIGDLSKEDADLLKQARVVTKMAYAPIRKFL